MNYLLSFQCFVFKPAEADKDAFKIIIFQGNQQNNANLFIAKKNGEKNF